MRRKYILAGRDRKAGSSGQNKKLSAGFAVRVDANRPAGNNEARPKFAEKSFKPARQTFSILPHQRRYTLPDRRFFVRKFLVSRTRSNFELLIFWKPAFLFRGDLGGRLRRALLLFGKCFFAPYKMNVARVNHKPGALSQNEYGIGTVDCIGK